MSLLYVFLGGGLGAVSRFGISKLTLHFFQGVFPLATLITNTLACLILGGILYYTSGKTESWMHSLLVVGFCGGFSTFSTFSNETLVLMNQGQFGYAITNVILSISLGLVTLYFWQLTAKN